MMAGPSSAPSQVALYVVVVGYFALFARLPDVALLAIFSLFRNRQLIADNVEIPSLQGTATVVGGSLLIAFLVSLCSRILKRGSDQGWEGPGKVLLFPCRTTHSRLFPKKHSFSYSYLVVGVPVDWKGNAGGIVSLGQPRSKYSWLSFLSGSGNGWYDINPGDYLERGRAELGLRGKLDVYLQSQGEDPKSFPYAYLVTAARFLGYHFNPVSFWYLYDQDKSLAAMILEVNNTFGERRMYFLRPGDSLPQLDGVPEDDELAREKRQEKPSRTVLKQVWPKDFHVSPFNSRKGSYSLTASDPLHPHMQGTGPVVNTINLVSSKGHGKLVARLVPAGPALDPYTMTSIEKLKFLASWWWVGFVTFPRIVKEAGLLFFRRKLHVWYRPEPLKESIGRQADSVELQLEHIFRGYLRHLVKQSAAPLAVKYVSSGLPEDVTEVMLSEAAGKESAASEAREEMEFKVLTPAFYARFVYYAHDLEALCCEFQESATVCISRPDLLPKLVLLRRTKAAPTTLAAADYREFVWFKMIQKLRVRPGRIERPLTSSATTSRAAAADQNAAVVVDIRDFRISPMDAYVLSHGDGPTRAAYRRCVLRLFLADRLALGIVPLLEVERSVMRACFAWYLSTLVGRFIAAWSI
ncbi:cyclopropane-fatty-acyl-phospholipid synthase [Echria macrotheca]|uniref:Cyclopropane-fatty-acyl-phospholipid synthase n=1 Tax=Echria macrotheca TaxID=438768 RepID=A0AAJ0B2R9_9PEZI|nr:cyclopropane-fatty-acyl-phospholipid synthase [Echria macrotheca]